MKPARLLSTLLPLLAGPGAASAFELAWPADCVAGKTCVIQNYLDDASGPAVHDYQCGAETYDGHDGIDIRVPTLRAMTNGVRVLAAAPGKVARLRDGEPDHGASERENVVVANRECGNGMVIDHGDGWETQYCHMKQGSLLVRPGDTVAAGAPLGQIGLSGNTVFPHVHLSVRRNGRTVNPFDPDGTAAVAGTCTPASQSKSLWDAATAKLVAYRQAEVLNVGFATGAMDMGDVESGRLDDRTLPASAPALVFFGRAIHLQKGDSQRLELRAPDGSVLAESETEPVERDKAQVFAFAGKKRSTGTWQAGTYTGRYTVLRGGTVIASADATLAIKD